MVADSAVADLPKRLQQSDEMERDSEYDTCMALAEQRERERAGLQAPKPITYRQAVALKAVKDRLHQLPPEYQSTVQLSSYLQVILGIPARD